MSINVYQPHYPHQISSPSFCWKMLKNKDCWKFYPPTIVLRASRNSSSSHPPVFLLSKLRAFSRNASTPCEWESAMIGRRILDISHQPERNKQWNPIEIWDIKCVNEMRQMTNNAEMRQRTSETSWEILRNFEGIPGGEDDDLSHGEPPRPF